MNEQEILKQYFTYSEVHGKHEALKKTALKVGMDEEKVKAIINKHYPGNINENEKKNSAFDEGKAYIEKALKEGGHVYNSVLASVMDCGLTEGEAQEMMEIYGKELKNENKNERTHLKAKEKYLTGDKQAAYDIAKQDEGWMGKTFDEFVAWMDKLIARDKTNTNEIPTTNEERRNIGKDLYGSNKTNAGGKFSPGEKVKIDMGSFAGKTGKIRGESSLEKGTWIIDMDDGQVTHQGASNIKPAA